MVAIIIGCFSSPLRSKVFGWRRSIVFCLFCGIQEEGIGSWMISPHEAVVSPLVFPFLIYIIMFYGFFEKGCLDSIRCLFDLCFSFLVSGVIHVFSHL